MYAYSDVIAKNPDVWIRGVDGQRTRVDAVVRTAVAMEDGLHVVSEVLICDSFRVALWSVASGICYAFRFRGHLGVGWLPIRRADSDRM